MWGVDAALARGIYERRIYMIGPGESVNRDWSALSGLNIGGDPPGCPTAFERGTSGGRTALFALVHYRPVEVARKDNTVVVKVDAEEGGLTCETVGCNP
jgi:hypothetical protein